MGWRSASSFSAWSSICCCSSSMRGSPPTALSAQRRVAPRDGFDGVGELRFGQAAHLGDAAVDSASSCSVKDLTVCSLI